MVLDYLKYAFQQSPPTSNLEILSDFIHKEIKMYSTGGFVDLARPTLHNNNMRSQTVDKIVCTTSTEQNMKRDDIGIVYVVNVEKCVRCNISGHDVTTCKVFARDIPSKRWSLVNRARLCYACL